MREREIMNLLRQDARLTIRQAASSLGESRHSAARAFRRALRKAGRFTIILDFRQMGFEIHALFLLEPRTIRLVKFLKQNASVNSVFGCRGNYSLMVYAIFRNMRRFADFDDRVSRLCTGKRIHFIVEEVKQEDAFL
ncbi:MAG: Lrp/AsnC family transcriptional regulator [Candidatus Nanoarchaeia archaeon]|nr:Lrp/AsnC family transcriptional regulator [Candidatus Nanoarchaeia archaeon]